MNCGKGALEGVLYLTQMEKSKIGEMNFHFTAKSIYISKSVTRFRIVAQTTTPVKINPRLLPNG